MTKVLALVRRELSVYFISPMAYIVLTFYLLMCGVYFWNELNAAAGFGKPPQRAILTFASTFQFISHLAIAITPLVTMRLIAEEKATGTLEEANVLPGKNLYLIATGTGLAPFLSIIRDPEIYENFDKVILVHGCRYVEELAYREIITEHLPNNEYFGDVVREKLIYYPTVTREKYQTNGRITDLLKSGKLASDIGLPQVTVDDDRFMLCGSPSMLKDLGHMLQAQGFRETRKGELGHYVVERAFVE